MFDVLVVENKKQLEDCFKVRYEVFTKEQGIPHEIDIDEYDELDINKSCHVIVYDNDEPIGTGRLKYRDEETVQFNRIAVIKEYRCKKVGSMVLDALELFSLTNGYKKVYLESQSTAKDFYLKYGYTDLGEEEFIEVGVPHIKLTKNLS